jgi:uncharacterized delta-60 repeat protein
LVFVAIVSITSSACYAEEWAIAYKVYKESGFAHYALAHSIQETSDGGYIVAGQIEYGNYQIWVLKLHLDGTIDWEKRYDRGNAHCIQETSDGGYIVAGYTSNDIWVLKLHPDGSIDWQKTYGGSGVNQKAWSIQELSDGGYIMAGSFGDDIWVLKLHPDGSIDWQKTYGGATGAERAHSIQQTTDGGYIVAGYTDSFGWNQTRDMWVLKLHPDGSIDWQKTYGGATGAESARSIQQTTDGGYIVAGSTESFAAGFNDFWVIKLYPDGEPHPGAYGAIEWAKSYGSGVDEVCRSIQQTSDGGYIMTGTVGGDDGYFVPVFKLNPDGTVAWEKSHNISVQHPYSIRETSDGGYIVAGKVGFKSPSHYDNLLVLKLDTKGEIPGCSSLAENPAIVSDTSVLVSNTSVTAQDSSVMPSDTDVSPIDTSAEPYLICPAPYIALISEKTSGKQGLLVHESPLDTYGEVGPPVATDRNFGHSNWGNNIIAMTCLDTNGDGTDEVAVIKQRLNGRQRLEIYNLPQTAPGDTGDPIASDLTFGNSNSDRNNVAITGADIDGDGIDELAVLREKQTGKQGLFIFNAPQATGVDIEPSIANYRHFGNSNGGQNIIAMSRIDINADGIDEIAVIRKRTTGQQRLEIYNAPQGLGAPKGEPVVSDRTFGSSTNNKNNIALLSLDINGDGKDEIAVVRQNQYGRQRLEIYNVPQTVGGQTGRRIADDLTFGQQGTDKNTKFISRAKF